MAGKYVKFQTPQGLGEKIKQAIERARETGGRVRKGINEVTKCIEAGKPALVVMAEDVSPEEIIIHIPMLCEERDVWYAYLPTRAEVGAAAGLNVPCSCIAIEREGQAGELVRDVREALEPVFPKKEEPKKEEKKPEGGAKAEKPKKPRAPRKKKEERGQDPKTAEAKLQDSKTAEAAPVQAAQ